MKFLINVSFCLILYISNLNSQSLNRLDDVNGFKDFKFNSNISQYSNFKLSKASGRSSEGFEYYYHWKRDQRVKLGNYDVESIIIYTFKGEIVKINVNSDYDLYTTLKETFGEPNIKELSSSSPSYNEIWKSASWKSNNVALNYFCKVKEGKWDDMIKMSLNKYSSSITFQVNNIDAFIKIAKQENQSNVADDFNSSISVSNTKIEPEEEFEPDIQAISLLNQKWYQTNEYGIRTTGSLEYENGKAVLGNKLVPTSNYTLSRFSIARNQTRPIVILSVEAYEKYLIEGNSFQGTITINLENGTSIKCNDRNINGSQFNSENMYLIFAVFYLSLPEYNLIENNGVANIVYRYGNPTMGYENYISKPNEDYKLDIKALNKKIKTFGFPK